uniref:Uncharacterized protein n=1 Tax=Anguilla anguilla TaxID=7936 RepID=A0A0E9VGW1_ANGAN
MQPYLPVSCCPACLHQQQGVRNQTESVAVSVSSSGV